MNSEQKRLLLAIVLSGIILFGWQMSFAPKREIKTNYDNQHQTTKTNNVVEKNIKNEKVSSVDDLTEVIDKEQTIAIEKFVIGNDEKSYVLTNNLTLENVIEREGSFQKVVGEKINPFSLYILVNGKYEKVAFSKIEKTDNLLKAKNKTYGITAILQDKDDKLNILLTSINPYRYRFVFSSEPKSEGMRRQREFSILVRGDVERDPVGDDEAGDGVAKWFGVDFEYHLFAFVFNNKTAVTYKLKESGVMIIDTVEAMNSLDGKLVFLKKDYNKLAIVGDQLQMSIDFGMFQIVAVPLLKSIQFFYKYFPNYGVAIILVTLLVRLILFPLNYKSFKSMKKMQVIQPEINKIKEKYKSDPQRMQKETMAAFKKAGANPLGGCLPILLQMPVFFAFYKVLFNSVEMVGAPFFLWIQDLSLKDPYYILPIAMAGVMLVQQIFMPTGQTDPMQKKIMYGMPIFMGFIFKDMPAGLCLYFFISNLCGVTQQFFVNKTVK